MGPAPTYLRFWLSIYSRGKAREVLFYVRLEWSPVGRSRPSSSCGHCAQGAEGLKALSERGTRELCRSSCESAACDEQGRSG